MIHCARRTIAKVSRSAVGCTALLAALILVLVDAHLKVATLPAAAEPAPGARSASFDISCLPLEQKELLLRINGRGREIAVCELPCLERPQLDNDDLRRIERRLGVSWCRSCEPMDGKLAITVPQAIARWEQAQGTTLCPVRTGLPRAPTQPLTLLQEDLRGVRDLFAERSSAAMHENLAVVLSLTHAAGPGADRTKLKTNRDGTAIAVMLNERLGYRSRNVAELRNPTRADFDRIFGDGTRDPGVLTERIAAQPNATIFVYLSGQGRLDGQGESGGTAPVLLLSGARGDEVTYPLDRLYQRLAETKAASVTVVLEVSFRAKQRSVAETALNLPEADVSPIPGTARRGFVAMTAAERDQMPLADTTSGLSLFTRYLVEALSGSADEAPSGNGDGGVDTTEAFVYAATRTGYVARKLFGVLQRPQISAVRPILLTGRPASGP